MKTYDFNDILRLVQQFSTERNLTGKPISVGYKRDKNAFTQDASYAVLIQPEETGYRILSELGTQVTDWNEGTRLRIEITEGENLELYFEVSPEGNLRFVSASDPAEVNLFTFRHDQELLESSALALALIGKFSDLAQEAKVDQFAVQLKGIVSETFLYKKDNQNRIYLSDKEEAFHALSQSILDSYFEPVTVDVKYFNSPDKYIVENEWTLNKGEAKDEGAEETVEVPDYIISSLKNAAEEVGQGTRGKVNPHLSKEEKQVLAAVFDPSLEKMHLLSVVHKEQGPIAETTVDAVKQGDETHLFVDRADVLDLVAQTNDENILLLVTRLIDGEPVTRVYSTAGLRELSDEEVEAL